MILLIIRIKYLAQTLVDGWLKENALSDLTNEVEFSSENWNKSTPVMLDSDSHFNRSESPIESARKWLDDVLIEPTYTYTGHDGLLNNICHYI